MPYVESPTTLAQLIESMQPKPGATDIDLLTRAYELAESSHRGQKRVSGEAYIHHPLAVAKILADMQMDVQTVAAALLHDVAEDTSVSLDEIQQQFGNDVARLVDGVTKLSKLDHLSQVPRNLQNEAAENLRKLLLAMMDDIRVILIKLADRLHNMRTLGSMPDEKRKRIARETLEIFAPLANRLGIWQIKWELEDLSFRYLDPEMYRHIAQQLDARRMDRERFIREAIRTLEAELRKHDIKGEVSGRPKHIYSIYNKMMRKNVDVDQIYDAQGIRVIVPTITDCYTTLGIVHSIWRPVPGNFDDYIATPKDTMYRSLHTDVIVAGGRTLEVQIRTPEMHKQAEYGIAAHWRYKEHPKKRDIDFENKLNWVRQVFGQVFTERQNGNATEYVDALKSDVFQDRVYAFTPAGEVKDLPAGSTPIDFAYHVHTDVGDRCRGARVNGKLVSLDYPLKTGDQVEIITAKRGGPSRDWLNPDLGYVRTTRARDKIRNWFRKQAREQNIVQGREILDKELHRLSVSRSHDEIASLFGFEKVDDFYAAIGYGDIGVQAIATKVQAAVLEEQARKDPQKEAADADLALLARLDPARDKQLLTQPLPPVHVAGAGNGFLTTVAKCCNPLPGDDIVGYVTRGRGISIHRRDCRNMLANKEPERRIEVDWGGVAPATYPVRIQVQAWDRPGLLRDIADLVAAEKINITDASTQTSRKDHTATILATLDITGLSQLSRVLAKIERLPNVLEVRRQVN